LNAKQVIELLKVKHKDDVFVPECKDGPTQETRHARLDAWVMNRSWAHPMVTGYEVKVSRTDFINDNKWHAYLPLCNCFYFVAPKGLIKLSELPQEIGLLEVATTGTLLRTVRKAQYRNVEIPESLYRYILMCRAKIADERCDHAVAEYWKRYVEGKSESAGIGAAASRKIREEYSKMQQRVNDVERQIAVYESHREALKAVGIDPDDRWDYKLKQRLDELKGPVKTWHLQALERLVKDATSLQESLREVAP